MAQYWTPKRKDALKAEVRKGLTDREIAASGVFPGKSAGSIAMARYKAGIPAGAGFRDHWKSKYASRTVIEDEQISVSAPQDTADPVLSELWDAAEKRTTIKVRQKAVQRFCELRILTDKPIALSISSDWHLTSRGACDLTGLRAYAEAVRDTPGCWAVAVGDQFDNPIKWDKAVTEVPDDLLLLGHLVATFGRKLLAYTSGNHDDWSRTFAGIDALRWIGERHMVHYAPDELVYTIRLIDPATNEETAKYVVATRHKYYRHSNLNPLHGCWRWLEDGVGNWPQGEDGELLPDVLAIGHNHIAEVGSRVRGDRTIWAARMGAWHRSRHSRAGGWPWSPPTAPTFVLYPHRARPIVGYQHYEQALELLSAERRAWSEA